MKKMEAFVSAGGGGGDEGRGGIGALRDKEAEERAKGKILRALIDSLGNILR